MSFNYKTADDTSSRGKANIYFCCHPADFKRYFEVIKKDIFSKRNCAIWYADPDDVRNDTFFEQLQEMRLFIMPVTTKLLYTPNPALDVDFRFAMMKHIPVLPLMMEPELADIFNRKCGELHFLDRDSQDSTAISYDTKLEKYLSAILFDGSMTDMIRSAFDAYVFLSYRKKDRKYANELLRSIHSDPAFRNIAVWYDEFLVPGESFRENIQQMMESCKLFTLLVTPRIAEKILDEQGIERDNYVVSTELPLARKNKAERGIDMIAVEMEKTDRHILQNLGLDDCTDYEDCECRNLLIQALLRIAPHRDDSPQRKLHIGLAYLGGVDVEINRELAVSLITEAAEADHAPAIAKLAGMYYNGEGVAIDLETSLHYYEKLCRIQEAEFRRTGTEKSVKDWIDTQDQIGSILFSLRRSAYARQHFGTMLQHCKKLSSPTIFSWQGRALLHGAKKAPYARYGKALARLGLAKLLKDSKDDDDRISEQYEDYLDDAAWDLLEYEDRLSDFGKKSPRSPSIPSFFKPRSCLERESRRRLWNWSRPCVRTSPPRRSTGFWWKAGSQSPGNMTCMPKNSRFAWITMGSTAPLLRNRPGRNMTRNTLRPSRAMKKLPPWSIPSPRRSRKRSPKAAPRPAATSAAWSSTTCCCGWRSRPGTRINTIPEHPSVVS